MFKEFFNRHISTFKAEDILLDAFTDTLENGMRLDILKSQQYSTEEKIKVGKMSFKFANSLDDDMYYLLGEVMLQREKAYSNLLGLDLFEYYLSLFTGAVSVIRKPYDLQSNLSYVNDKYRPNEILITNLKDEYAYLDYDEAITVADYFVNINLTNKENNTILKNLSNLALIKMVKLGIKYFLKDKYVMLNLQYDNISDEVDSDNNLTYLVSSNNVKQINIGYFKADGRKLPKTEYLPYAFYVGNDNTSNEVYLTSVNKRVYLGFITDYLLKELVIDDNLTFPDLVLFLNFQRHSLKRLRFTDDAGTNFSYTGGLELYQLEEFVNKSTGIIINNIPSLKIKHIDISESSTDTTSTAVLIQWFLNRNVFNVVLKVNGNQLGSIDFETLMKDLGWQISYIGTLGGTYSVGTIKLLPNNQETSWLICTGYYTSVYEHTLLWYYVRNYYRVEDIRNQTEAFFYIPNIEYHYIYRGKQADYDAITELNFENKPVTSIYFPNVTNQFTNLEKLKVYGDFNTILIDDTNITDIAIIGEGNEFRYEALTYNIEDNNFDTILISNAQTLANTTTVNYVGQLDTNELTDGLYINRPISYLFFALFDYIENLSKFRLEKAIIDQTVSPISFAKPSGTAYTHIVDFELEDVVLYNTGFHLGILDKVTIDNLSIINLDNTNFDFITNDLRTLFVDTMYNVDIFTLNSPNITSITIKNSDIDGDFQHTNNQNLTSLTLVNTFINLFEFTDLPNSNIVLNDNTFNIFRLENHNLNAISLIGNTVNSEINVSSLVSFEYVHCDNDNTILELNVSGGCTDADLRNKKIGSFIGVNTVLNENTLANFNWSEVTIFNIEGNTGFTVLDLSFALELQELNIKKTNLTDIVIDTNTNLTTIELSETAISSLDISANSNITEIYANNTQFDAADIEDILVNLQIFGNSNGTYESNIFSGTLSANALSIVNDLQTNFGWTINLY